MLEWSELIKLDYRNLELGVFIMKSTDKDIKEIAKILSKNINYHILNTYQSICTIRLN